MARFGHRPIRPINIRRICLSHRWLLQQVLWSGRHAFDNIRESHRVFGENLHHTWTTSITSKRQWSTVQIRSLEDNGIEHRKTTPLWPQTNSEVERQNKSLLKRMKIAQAEGKEWKKEVCKYLVAYRSTPHTTTGVSPAELLFGRKMLLNYLNWERRAHRVRCETEMA